LYCYNLLSFRISFLHFSCLYLFSQEVYYTLNIEEAAQYFRIGEHKLRQIINENKNADFVLWNGNRLQIKRKLFEKYIDQISSI